MQEEWYIASERDKLRAAAFAATPAGKKFNEELHEQKMRYLHRRIKEEGFVPSPKALKLYQEWEAKHPELYTNPHK